MLQRRFWGKADFRQNKLEWTAALFVLVLVAWGVWQGARHLSPGHTENPYRLRLLGIRPSAGDRIYDSAGKLLREEFYDGDDLSPWSSNTTRRDFIFELGATNVGRVEAFLFAELAQDRGSPFPISATVYPLPGGHKRIVAQANLPKVAPRRTWLFWRRLVPVDCVDLKLIFYDERAPDYLARCQGPFTLNTTLEAGTSMTVTPSLADPADPGVTRFQIIVPPSQQLHQLPPVLVRDKQGTKQPLTNVRRSLGAQGYLIDFQIAGVDLDQIGEVTLLQAREARFFNVQVRYPDDTRWADRDYPEVGDKLVAALGLNCLPSKAAASYEFKSAAEVLQVLDLLRGSLITQAWRLLRPSLNRETAPRTNGWKHLPAETQARIRQTAGLWCRAANPQVRLAGTGLGLVGEWPEFVGPALDLLEVADTTVSIEVATLLRHHAKILSAEDVRRVAAAAQQATDPGTGDRSPRSAEQWRAIVQEIQAGWQAQKDDESMLKQRGDTR